MFFTLIDKTSNESLVTYCVNEGEMKLVCSFSDSKRRKLMQIL